MLIRSCQRSLMRSEMVYQDWKSTGYSNEHTFYENIEISKTKQKSLCTCGGKSNTHPMYESQADLPWMLTQWFIGKSLTFLNPNVLVWKAGIIIEIAHIIRFQNYGIWEEHYGRWHQCLPLSSSFPSWAHGQLQNSASLKYTKSYEKWFRLSQQKSQWDSPALLFPLVGSLGAMCWDDQAKRLK